MGKPLKDDHFRKLQNMYKCGRCNDYFASKLTVSEKSATITIPIREDFFHSGNAAHGVVYFKALDDAAFFAVNSMVPDVLVLTTSFNLYFMRPVSSGIITAKGKVVSSSSRLWVAESHLLDEKGREIARGSGSFVKGTAKLVPEIGYQ